MKKTPLDKLIEAEKEGQDRYSEMREKASLSNIRYFLKAFSEARGNFVSCLRGLKEGKHPDPPQNIDKIIDLHATEHLTFEDKPDLTSLSSTLLYISTQEKEMYNMYVSSLAEINDKAIHDSLETITEHREQVRIKADRLYHDLVQTSY